MTKDRNAIENLGEFADAAASVADGDDSEGRYGGPHQWDQWVKDARKSFLEAIGLFSLGVGAFALDANSSDPRLVGWVLWMVCGFTVWFGFAIPNRAFKWRETALDRRLWLAEADGQDAYERETAARNKRSQRHERFWSRLGKGVAWIVGGGALWYFALRPLSDAPDWAKGLAGLLGSLAAYTVSTLEEIKKRLK
jgi:hypothetical protein